MPPVFCSEGQVRTANAGQKFAFGHVDSCMTITCSLADGSRVAAHFVQFGQTQAMLGQMRTMIGGRTVKLIQAVGQLTTWTPDLQEQYMVVQRATQSWPPARIVEMQSMSMQDVDARFGDEFLQYSIAGNKAAFTRFISMQLMCTDPMLMVSVAPWKTGYLSY